MPENVHSRPLVVLFQFLAEPLYTANVVLSGVSFLINCLHLFVLTRKSMKPSSTNAVMIGIAISDIFTLLLTVEKHLTLVDIENNECVTSNSLLKVHIDMLAWALQDYFRRCSTWLGLLMATVRTLVVQNATSSNHSRLSKSTFGWLMTVLIFVLAAIPAVFFYFRFQITENRKVPLPISCEEFQNIYKPPKYSLSLIALFKQNNQLLIRTFFMVDAVISKFVPCLCFPILTILLIRGLRKASKTRNSIKFLEKSDPTTKLVIFMTIAFFLAEAPLGCIFMVKAFFHNNNGVQIISVDVVVVFACLLTINSTCHFFFCIFLSRQYRATLRHVLGLNILLKLLGNSRKNNNSVTRKTSSVFGTRPVVLVSVR